MATATFYSLSNVCQYLTMHRLLVLCHYVYCCLLQSVPYLSVPHILPSVVLCPYVHCCLLQSAHCLSVPHNIPPVGSVSLCLMLPSTVCPLSLSTSHCTFCCSVSLCPLLSSTVCPMSVSTSQYTACWFCVTMFNAAFYSLSTISQYLTLYLMLFCVSMSTAVFYSLSTISQYLALYRLLFWVTMSTAVSTVCPLSVSTSHCTACWFCVIMSTAVFYSLSTISQYLTLYRLLVLCHYVHCCLLQSVHYLSVPHTVPSVGYVSLCPLLSSTVCPLSLSTSHCAVCCLCHYVHCCLLHSVHYLSVPHVLPSVFLCLYVHCCLLQSVHSLSVPHNIPPVGSVSLGPLPSYTLCPLSVSTSHCTVCWFCVTISTAFFYTLSTISQYLTLYRLLVLCHYVHCCPLQSVHCLSVPHTVPSVCSVSLCLMLPSTVCPLSVST